MKIDTTLANSQVQREPLPIGAVAPNFSLLTHDGKKGVSLTDYRGQSVLVVLTKSNCWPCEVLAPKLEEGSKKNKRNIAIVMINHDKDGAETSKKVEEHGLTFPVLVQRHWSQVFAKYGCFGTPTGFLIDGEGTIVGVGTGPKDIIALLGFSFERRRILKASGAAIAGLALMHRLPEGVSLVQAQDSGTCPNRVLRPDYVCRPNLCGSTGGIRWPNRIIGAWFGDCCNDHDCGDSWGGRCGDHVRGESDDKFALCLVNACESAYGWMKGFLAPNLYELCIIAAGLYESGVRSDIGTQAFIAAQRDACVCVDGGGGGGGGGGGQCPNPRGFAPFCDGGANSCNNQPLGIGSGCACVPTVEGQIVCVQNGLCRDTSRIIGCDHSDRCPPGHYCIETCCAPNHTGNPGRSTRCAPICGSVAQSIDQFNFDELSGEDFDDSGLGIYGNTIGWIE